MVDLHRLLDEATLSLIGLPKTIANFPDAGSKTITNSIYLVH
jgi:hypothetical protein